MKIQAFERCYTTAKINCSLFLTNVLSGCPGHVDFDVVQVFFPVPLNHQSTYRASLLT